MSIIVLIRGEPSEKIVNDESQTVIPFVGIEQESSSTQMGIGLIIPDQGIKFWGLLSPHALIQSWRGMKILEQVKCVEKSTLCACWEIATREIHSSNRRYLNEIASQFGGLTELEQARKVILTSAPTAEGLEYMINIIRENNIKITIWDLVAEIETGLITTSPLIETLIQENSENQKTDSIKSDETNNPPQTPPSLIEDILSKLFSLFR